MTTYLLEHALLPDGISDDVYATVVGGRFNVAARAGLIVDTGKRVASTLGSTHGHEVRVWRGARAASWHPQTPGST